MSFSFLDLAVDTSEITRTSLAGLTSLKEYVESLSIKFKQLVAGDLTGTFSLPIQSDEDGITYVCQLTSEQVNNIINETDGEFTLPVTDSGDTITVSTESLNNQIQNLLSETQVQKEFLSSILNDVVVTAQSFATTLLTKYQSMSADIVDRYSTYFDSCDKLNALRQWVQTVRADDLTKTNDGIKLVKREDYTGQSVWVIILTDFVNAVETAFDKVWQGIQDLKGFFERLWKGIIKLGKWILRTAVKPLTTNLTAGNSRIGICDIPILQVKLGSLTASWPYYEIDSTLSSLENDFGSKANVNYNNHIKLTNDVSGSLGYENVISRVDINLFGAWMDRLLDTIFPAGGHHPSKTPEPIDITINHHDAYGDHSSVIRIGPVDSNQIWLQVFAAIPADYLDYASDVQVLQEMRRCWNGLILEITSRFPLAFTTGSTDLGIMTMCYNNALTPPTQQEEEDDGPIDFYSHVGYLQNSDLSADVDTVYGGNITAGAAMAFFILHGILPMANLFCGNAYVYGAAESLKTFHYPISSVVKYDLTKPDINVTEYQNFTLPIDWNDRYQPYLRSSLCGTTIHCQSLAEQADELEKYIIGAIIAIATVVIAIKTAKYISNIRAKATLARGAADNFSWSTGVNPSTSDINQWKKLNRVAKRYERLEGFLGAASPVSLFHSVQERVFDNNETSNISLSQIYNIIRG